MMEVLYMSKKINRDDLADFCGNIYLGEDYSKKKKKKKKDGSKKSSKKDSNKKKGKKKKDYDVKKSVGKCINNVMNEDWDNLLDNMDDIIKGINKADKKSKIFEPQSGKVKFSKPSKESMKIRTELSETMESSNFLDMIATILVKGLSIAKLIAKAFCVIVVAIFSIDSVKAFIPDNIMNKIGFVYNLANNFS